MKEPKYSDFDTIVSSINTLSTIYKSYQKSKQVKSILGLVESIKVLVDKPSISRGIDPVIKSLGIFSSSPILKLFLGIHQIGIDQLVKMLSSVERYSGIRDEIMELDVFQYELVESRRFFIKNYKFDENIFLRSSKEFSWSVFVSGLDHKDKVNLFRGVRIIITGLIYNIDVILWYKYNYEKRINELRKAIPKLQESDEGYDNIFSNQLKAFLDQSRILLEFSWQDGIKDLLLLRNNWSSWLDNSKVNKSYFVNREVGEIEKKPLLEV